MINLTTFEVLDTPTLEEGVRFLKTQFNENELRFKERFIKPLRSWLLMNKIKETTINGIIEIYINLFNNLKKYSYQEAFAIDNNTFRAKVFSVINVPEMIKFLGHKRIKTDGIKLNNKIFNPITRQFENTEHYQIYELHEIDGTKLEINEKIYAIKCWCTSTESEHWLWTLETNDPLQAISQTCWIYKPMLNKIKHIIRQGDVFLFEMLEHVNIKEDDEKIALDKDVYFSLLKSQA